MSAKYLWDDSTWEFFFAWKLYYKRDLCPIGIKDFKKLLATQLMTSHFLGGNMLPFLDSKVLLCNLLSVSIILKTLIFPVTEGILLLPSSSQGIIGSCSLGGWLLC